MSLAPAPELLVVVLDARLALLTEGPRETGSGEAGADQGARLLLPLLWDALLILLRAHNALACDQQAALLAAHGQRTQLLAEGLCRDVDWEAARRAMVDFILEEAEEGDSGPRGPPLLAAALSRALCYASRAQAAAKAERRELPARVLVLDGSAREHDLATQAAALLSSAFAAQAAAIPVDCMSLGPESSTALRQVAALTGGKHHALPPASAASAGAPPAHRPHAQGEVLVPAMLFHFLPGVAVRRQLNVTQDVQNLSAVCSCHGEAQEIGHVCSCCLAVYCSDCHAICPACRTRFRQDYEPDPRVRDLGLEAAHA